MSDEPRSLNSSERNTVVAETARLLRERFNQIEREALVYELDVNPEDVKLNPETRDDFTWAMIAYFERRGRLGELCAAAARAVEQRGPSRAPGAVVKRTTPERRSAILLELATRLARRRAVLLGACVLLSLCATPAVAAALYQPSATLMHYANVPGCFIWLSALSSDGRVPQTTSRILVGLKPRSSPEAAQAHQELCNKLKEVGGAGVQCPHLEDHNDDLLARAKEVGASLAVSVEQNATAHPVPLGRLADDALLKGGLRPIDISRSGVADRLSPVLNQLSIIAASDFETRDAVCILLPEGGVAPGAQGVVDEISLLAIYTRQFGPWCIADDHECALLGRVASCNPRSPEPSLSCELAKYLLVERCPSSHTTASTLTTLTGPDITGAYRSAAMLKLARQYCGKGSSATERETASRMLFELASREEPCMTAALSEVATCLVLASAGGGLEASQKEKLRQLAALPLDGFDACGNTTVAARAIAGRAFRRALAGQWRAAAADYNAAYQRHHLDDYLLDLAESLLHVGSTDEVQKAIALLRYGGATLRPSAAPGESGLYLWRISLRRAVLSWIAANKLHLPKDDLDAHWEQVVHEYTAYEGDAGASTDEGLKALLARVHGGKCVFRRLSRADVGTKEERINAMRSCMSN